MKRGAIKWFDENKGFGFIETDQGEEIFFHRSGLKESVLPGDIVFFRVVRADRGLKAVDIRRKRS
jgi:CspA family cold shock protein